MPRIELSTEISSSVQICFDLSRSVDLHKLSTAKTNEEAVAGKTSGLLDLNETVTWRATHFFIRQNLTTKITALQSPIYFVDKQLNEIFKSLRQQHIFTPDADKVIRTHIGDCESPAGILGQLFNRLVLTRCWPEYLMARNRIITRVAECSRWRAPLDAMTEK